MTTRPRRSALYMPGSNARAMEKAKSLPADVLIFDLEDAVVPEAKAEARGRIAAALRGGGYGRRELAVRINGLGTPWCHDDVAVISAAGPDAILLPKATSAEQVGQILSAMANAPAKTRLWLMIETPRAIVNLASIAALAGAGSRLSLFAMGTNDLVKDTRAELDANRSQAIYWLSATVTAARAYGIEVLDGVYNNFRDTQGFRRECMAGKSFGMDGKTVIHPDQVGIANEVFSPDPAEVAWSRKVLAAFEQPENAGKGAISLEGRMVELLHAEIARRIVGIADAIEQAKG